VAITRGACLGLEPGGWHLASEVRSLEATRPDYELHLWLDDQGHPITAQMRTGIATAYYDWTPTSLRISMHGDAHTLRFDAPRHDIWVLPSHAMYMRESMLRLGAGASEAGVLQLGFVPEVGDILPLPLVPDEEGALVVGDAMARFILSPESTRLADLRILEVLADDEPAYRQHDPGEPMRSTLPEVPAPRYALNDGLRTAEVTVPGKAGAPALAGELVMGPAPEEGRLPGIVFISGSGPQDRYGFVAGTSIDIGSHEIHDALARAGFAVLRYDDRGVGDSERGDDATPGFYAQVDDARRAVAFLSGRPEIDPKRVFVLGHGEGALTASILAGERKTKVAGAVLLSPAARDARELIYWQLRRSMVGADDAKVSTAVAKAKAIHDAVLADKELPATSEPMRDWMQEIFAEDPLARLSRARVPILAVAGDKDFQTDAELDFGPIASALEKNARKGSQSRLFSGLDHLLKPEPGQSTVGHYGDLTRRVDPEFLDYLTLWCRQRAGL
jgi:pimeloyl-ACP methyl ester carboxylesterase